MSICEVMWCIREEELQFFHLFIRNPLLNLSKRKFNPECHKVYSSKVINKLTSLGWLTFAPMHVIGRGRYDEIWFNFLVNYERRRCDALVQIRRRELHTFLCTFHNLKVIIKQVIITLLYLQTLIFFDFSKKKLIPVS